MKKIFSLIALLIILFCDSQTPGSESAIEVLDASIPYQGFDESEALLGQLQYKIYYDNVDGVLDKPIIVLDGFDPGDSRSIDGIFNSFSAGNNADLISTVRNEGFDIIIVNFPTYNSVTNGIEIDGGADFLQRNAFSIVALLQYINSLTSTTNANVLIGPSMGGLISRYALAHMEQNGIDHETRLYISFDAPHQGANIPISIQYAFNYLVNNPVQPQTALEPVLASLNSAAAKQMLIDHYSAHVDTDGLTQIGSNLPKGAENYRDSWQAEIDALGFPQDTRNIAVVNGDGNGVAIGSPGANIIDTTLDLSASLRVTPTLNFTPSATTINTAFNLLTEVFVFSWVPVSTYTTFTESPSFTDGVDSAPGGLIDISSLDDGSNPLLTDFVNNLNQSQYCFIPTISALAMTGTDNWYTVPTITNNGSNSNTVDSSPFDNIFIPNNNETHVQVTDSNVTFILNEILAPNLSLPNFEHQFTLVQNPLRNNTLVMTSSKQGLFNVDISDISGKVVFKDIVNLSERVIIPLNVNSGFYILHIHDNSGVSFKTKIIVD